MINKSFFRHLLNNQIIVALIVLGFAWLVVELISVVIAGFIAYIIMAAISPIVERLTGYGIPKALAAAGVYLLIVVILFVLIFPLVPFLVNQTTQLFTKLPAYIQNATELIGVNISREELQEIITSQIGAIGSNALQVTTRVFGGAFNILTIIVLSFYLLLDHTRVKNSVASLFSNNSNKKAVEILSKVEYKLGAWLRGQIFLSLFIGVFTWVGLSLIGLEYALPLALLAGMLEIVPTLGPIIAAIPAILIALSVSLPLAIVVTGFYILIQIIENNFLVPRIMQRAVGLHPIIVILGIIVGGRLLGIIGALLAVPFISLIIVVASEVRKRR